MNRTATPRPLRTDAERNRRLILEAASEAFADQGVDVSLAEIARRAGVGFATLQRRFPTKDALITEVVRNQLVHIGRDPARASGLDAWQAFAAPVLECCEHQAREPGLAGPIARMLAAASEPSVREPILEALAPLLTRAQAEGALREDVSVDDVLLILKANAGVVANSHGREEEASRRFVDLALRGLRP